MMTSKPAVSISTVSFKLMAVLTLLMSAPLAVAHQNLISDQPLKACTSHKIGDLCDYTNAHQDVYRGTCRDMGDVLMCVRNKPIEKHPINVQQQHDQHSADEHLHGEVETVK